MMLLLRKDISANGIAVILSGLDADGAQALKAFHELGGVTIVQNPRGAEQQAMPLAAITTGFVDYVLNPEEIADELNRIARLPRESRTKQTVGPSKNLCDC
jgi:two-component system, chemotaxis family, CheB/CheR fusion protein